jgi:hypothetical protein
MLQQTTKGNLEIDEQRLLDNGLTEMRFRFVQISTDMQQRATASAGSSAAAEPAGGAEEEKPRIILPDGGKGSKSV